MSKQLSNADRAAVQVQLALRKEEPSFVSWFKKKTRKGEERILVVTRSRLFTLAMRGDQGRVAREAHLLEITSLVSHSPDELTITTRNFTVPVHCEKVEELLFVIRRGHQAIFPHMLDSARYKLDVIPLSRVKNISLPDMGPCGGFSYTYRAVCELYNTTALRSLLYDIEHIFPVNNVEELNLAEILEPNQMSFTELRPIFESLHYNRYFKTLIGQYCPLDKISVQSLFDIFKHNQTISTLSLVGAGIKGESLQHFSSILLSNQSNALTHIDLSFNTFDERGLIAFSNSLAWLSHGLVSLNLSRCSLTPKAMNALFSALKQNPETKKTLRSLNLAFNRLEVEGSYGLFEFLSSFSPENNNSGNNPNNSNALNNVALVELKLSSTGVSLSQLFNGLQQGQIDQLVSLDISKNRVVAKADLISFANWLKQVKKLKILNCCGILSPSGDPSSPTPVTNVRSSILGLPDFSSSSSSSSSSSNNNTNNGFQFEDNIKEVFRNLFCNKFIEGLHLNFSENRLGCVGATLLSQIFNHHFTTPPPHFVASSSSIPSSSLKSASTPTFGCQPIQTSHQYVSKTFASLDLSENEFGDEGFQLVCQGLGHASSLEDLGLGRNLRALATISSSSVAPPPSSSTSPTTPSNSSIGGGSSLFSAASQTTPATSTSTSNKMKLRQASIEALIWLLNESDCSVRSLRFDGGGTIRAASSSSVFSSFSSFSSSSPSSGLSSLTSTSTSSSSSPLSSLSSSKQLYALQNDLLHFLYSLTTNVTLTSLDISGHLIGLKGFRVLSKVIQVNKSLLRLVMDDNGMNSGSIEALYSGLKRNSTLIEILTPFNDLTLMMRNENEAKLGLVLLPKIDALLDRNRWESQKTNQNNGGNGSNNQNQNSGQPNHEPLQRGRNLTSIVISNATDSISQNSLSADQENKTDNKSDNQNEPVPRVTTTVNSEQLKIWSASQRQLIQDLRRQIVLHLPALPDSPKSESSPIPSNDTSSQSSVLTHEQLSILHDAQEIEAIAVELKQIESRFGQSLKRELTNQCSENFNQIVSPILTNELKTLNNSLIQLVQTRYNSLSVLELSELRTSLERNVEGSKTDYEPRFLLNNAFNQIVNALQQIASLLLNTTADYCNERLTHKLQTLNQDLNPSNAHRDQNPHHSDDNPPSEHQQNEGDDGPPLLAPSQISSMKRKSFLLHGKVQHPDS